MTSECIKENISPKVSVVIPVYNVENYLRECIESITAQTLRDIEIICVNDGSTDASLSIIKEFCAKDSRIILIDQENRGVSCARNRGFDKAVGKYVYYMDSDDYLEPDALETLYAISEEKELEVLQFDYTVFFDGITDVDRYQGTIIRKEYSQIQSGISYLKALKDDNVYACPVWMLFFRRDFLLEQKIRFYEGIIHEDELYTFEVLLKARRVSHVGKTFFHRRYRPDSIMTAPTSAKNVVGSFTVAAQMLRYCLTPSDEPLFTAESWRAFYHMIYISRMLYNNLSDEERQKISFENPGTLMLFDLLMLENFIIPQTPGQTPGVVKKPVPPAPESKKKKILRKIRNVFICLREHGPLYTVKKAAKTLCGKKD